MSYSKFTNLETVLRKFQVQAKGDSLFHVQKTIAPSAWLVETLERSTQMRFASEKERSERLVNPVLQEICSINNYEVTLYAGRELNVDPKNGLSGECDYLLSWGTLMDFVDVPVFSVVEAKKNDIEYGSAQCAAQMIGATKFNESHGAKIPVVFGAATTGTEWRFLKLENNMLTLDDDRYFINNVPELLAVLQEILIECKQLVK
jgi:hypothetical protein